MEKFAKFHSPKASNRKLSRASTLYGTFFVQLHIHSIKYAHAVFTLRVLSIISNIVMLKVSIKSKWKENTLN